VLGAAVGFRFPVGRRMEIIPDVGIVSHLNQLRGIPVRCDAVKDQNGSYLCGFEAPDASDVLVFNMRALPIGPRARVGLFSPSFGKGVLTLRWAVRLGYSPLTAFLPETTSVRIETDDLAGAVYSDADVQIAADSRFLLLHEFLFSTGIRGTY